MTTRLGIATFAAVSSAVLFFGNTAHAEGPTYIGNPLTLTTINDSGVLKPVKLIPSEIAAPVSQPTPPALMPAPKFETKLPEPVAIAQAPAKLVPITHPVTDPSNSYAWGQCTWYAKQRRPDLPNNLGNANTWYSSAAAQGLPVGTEARVGAIGTTSEGAYGHVVYVESVNDDGSVNISEMNYAGGVGVVHYRTVSASSFNYIY